jgi:hypothetical protein
MLSTFPMITLWTFERNGKFDVTCIKNNSLSEYSKEVTNFKLT